MLPTLTAPVLPGSSTVRSVFVPVVLVVSPVEFQIAARDAKLASL
jgi:hypothetical protein